MRQGGTRIRAQHTLGDKEDSGAQASNAMEGLGATFGETLEIDVDIAEIRNLRLRKEQHFGASLSCPHLVHGPHVV